MKHTVKLAVIDKKCYPEIQEKYCADPHSGSCPCYNVVYHISLRRGNGDPKIVELSTRRLLDFQSDDCCLLAPTISLETPKIPQRISVAQYSGIPLTRP